LLRLLWGWKGSKDNDCKKTRESHEWQRYKTKEFEPNKLAWHFDVTHAGVQIGESFQKPVVGRNPAADCGKWNSNFPDAFGAADQCDDQNDCEWIHHEALKPAQATGLVVDDFRKVQTAEHARGCNSGGEWSGKWEKGRESVLSPRL